ncbi:MAG: Ppx/GppA family phosphatase [Burkholderiales bacterium]|nr:Ppx/GppA family phosphatase [Burkholderiales bacterium]
MVVRHAHCNGAGLDLHQDPASNRCASALSSPCQLARLACVRERAIRAPHQERALETDLTLAALDLGSNSFRLELGRIADNRIVVVDSHRIAVRLAAGLTADKLLDDAAWRRGLDALGRFAQRLSALPHTRVRAVGTNTLRVARNAPGFIAAGERVLGHPIEVIAGREEARMIFCGVAHAAGSTPADERLLVVDIGGGSTEISVGTGDEPDLMESLYVGSINSTLSHFPGGYIDEYTFKQAELAARREIQVVSAAVRSSRWSVATASSGTARTIARLLAENHGGDGSITAAGLRWLRKRVIALGVIERLQFAGLKAERALNLPGGLAIMTAIFEELGIERMTVSPNALRLGVLVDLMRRLAPRRASADSREETVIDFETRYRCDNAQSARVSALAVTLFGQICGSMADPQAETVREIDWAARLAEVGFSIAHNGYHKHSSYVIGNADMPGFSRDEQKRLAFLILGHAGKLPKLAREAAPRELWLSMACLRLAALMHRGRGDAGQPPLALRLDGQRLRLDLPEPWLSANPLAAYSLMQEARAWQALGADPPFVLEMSEAVMAASGVLAAA